MKGLAGTSNTAGLLVTGNNQTATKSRWNRSKLDVVPNPNQIIEVQPERLLQRRWSISPLRRMTSNSTTSSRQRRRIKKCASADPLCPQQYNSDSAKERNVNTKSAHSNSGGDADAEKGSGVKQAPKKLQREQGSIAPQRPLMNPCNSVPTAANSIQNNSNSAAELSLSSNKASGNNKPKAEKQRVNQQEPKLQLRRRWSLSPQRRLNSFSQQQDKNECFLAGVPRKADPFLEDTSTTTNCTCTSSLDESNRPSVLQTTAKTQSQPKELSSSSFSIHSSNDIIATNSTHSTLSINTWEETSQKRVPPKKARSECLELSSSSHHSVTFSMEIMVHEHVVSNSYGLGPAHRSSKKPIRGELERNNSFKRASHTRCPVEPVVCCTQE